MCRTSGAYHSTYVVSALTPKSAVGATQVSPARKGWANWLAKEIPSAVGAAPRPLPLARLLRGDCAHASARHQQRHAASAGRHRLILLGWLGALLAFSQIQRQLHPS